MYIASTASDSGSSTSNNPISAVVELQKKYTLYVSSNHNSRIVHLFFNNKSQIKCGIEKQFKGMSILFSWGKNHVLYKQINCLV